MKIHTDPGCATTINLVISWPDVRRTPIFFSPKDKAKDKQETENSFMWFGGSGYILFNSHPPSASPYLPDIRIALTHTQDKNILHGRRTAMEQCGFLAVLHIHKHRECEHVNQEEIRRKSAKAKNNKVSKWGTRNNVEAKPQEKKEKQRLCENSALCNVSLSWLKQHLLQKPATDEDESLSGTAMLIETKRQTEMCRTICPTSSGGTLTHAGMKWPQPRSGMIYVSDFEILNSNSWCIPVSEHLSRLIFHVRCFLDYINDYRCSPCSSEAGPKTSSPDLMTVLISNLQTTR